MCPLSARKGAKHPDALSRVPYTLLESESTRQRPKPVRTMRKRGRGEKILQDLLVDRGMPPVPCRLVVSHAQATSCMAPTGNKYRGEVY